MAIRNDENTPREHLKPSRDSCSGLYSSKEDFKDKISLDDSELEDIVEQYGLDIEMSGTNITPNRATISWRNYQHPTIEPSIRLSVHREYLPESKILSNLYERSSNIDSILEKLVSRSDSTAIEIMDPDYNEAKRLESYLEE